jgi:hypothetical protein
MSTIWRVTWQNPGPLQVDFDDQGEAEDYCDGLLIDSGILAVVYPVQVEGEGAA